MAKPKNIPTPQVEESANNEVNNNVVTTLGVTEIKKRGKKASNRMTVTLDKTTAFKITFECDPTSLSLESLLRVSRTGYLAILKTAATKYFQEYGPVTSGWNDTMARIDAQKDNPSFNMAVRDMFVELQKQDVIAKTGIDPTESLRLHWVINDALILGTEETEGEE